MSSLICRKCKGNHLTIKCGKIDKTNNYNKKYNSYNKKTKFKNKYTIKIENLPNDITVSELNYLVKDWGNIGKINLNYSEIRSAYIEFYDKEDAEWFVEALDKTPFDHQIINVILYKVSQ